MGERVASGELRAKDMPGQADKRTNMTANIFMTWQLALEELIKN